MLKAADHSNSGNPEGISKECGKGGKPASWLSTLSILCHFHGLLFAQGDARISATSTRAMGRTRKDVFVVIVVDECFGDEAQVILKRAIIRHDCRL